MKAMKLIDPTQGLLVIVVNSFGFGRAMALQVFAHLRGYTKPTIQ